MDPIGAISITFGAILLAFSWVMLINLSFKEDYNWGLCSIFFPPLSYLYSLLVWEKSKEVMSMTALAWVLLLIGCSTL